MKTITVNKNKSPIRGKNSEISKIEKLEKLEQEKAKIKDKIISNNKILETYKKQKLSSLMIIEENKPSISMEEENARIIRNEIKKKPITKANLILSSRNPKKENTPVINTSVENIDNNLQGLTSKNSSKNFGVHELKMRDKSANANKYNNKKSLLENDSNNLLKNKIFNREMTKKLVKKSVFTPSNKNLSNEGFMTPSKNKIKFNLNLNYLVKESSRKDEDTFEYEEEKELELTNEEKITYGSREPKEFRKIKILGKGGCGMVWLCRDNQGKEYAVKQIAKKKMDNNIHTIIARREIDIVNYLQNKLDSENDINNYIINLIDYCEDNNDLWMIFEKGGKSLSCLLFKIKGEFLGNERIYCIKKGKLLVELFKDISNFKMFFKKMLQFIHFLTKSGVVHCDIKPDNILIEYKYDENEVFQLTSIKMIDFGSAFFINNPDNFSSNTPEYMSPEINELIEKNASVKEITAFLKSLKNYSWCIDIWSLGVTILEIILSCPLWMSYKAKIVIYGKIIYKTGLFGVKGRSGSKIYNRQLEVSSSINKLMQESLVKDEKDQDLLCDLLSQMLDINYKTRISPLLALQHDFFKENTN